MEPKEKKRMDYRQILIILAVAMAFYVVFDLSGRISAANEMAAERDLMGTRVAGLQQTEIFLQTQIAYATQPAFIEDYIRPEGKLVQPGDIPIIPIPGDEIQPTQAAILPTPQPTYTNWEVWWALFFGN
jgi:cell division protein FtsB